MRQTGAGTILDIEWASTDERRAPMFPIRSLFLLTSLFFLPLVAPAQPLQVHGRGALPSSQYSLAGYHEALESARLDAARQLAAILADLGHDAPAPAVLAPQLAILGRPLQNGQAMTAIFAFGPRPAQLSGRSPFVPEAEASRPEAPLPSASSIAPSAAEAPIAVATRVTPPQPAETGPPPVLPTPSFIVTVPDRTPTPQPTPRPAYTGVIVDARGTGLTIGLLPRLLDTRRNVIADFNSVDPEIVRLDGVVAYVASLADALRHPRAGSTPVRVKSTASVGPDRLDIVLADDAIRHAGGANALQAFWSSHKVVVIVDGP
jgi:hypothetical protein